MARPPRIDIPGLVYHVFNRGVKKLPIFHDDEDRFEFMDWLNDAKSRFGIEIEHHSLMTNHFHLLIRLGEGSLSCMMQSVMGKYARWFNRKYESSGHAFQGRFGSIPVQEDAYYTIVSSYIHVNAVRAGLVKYPEDYRWCNYANLIQGQKDPLSSGGIILAYFGTDPNQQRFGYRRFVEDRLLRPDPVNEKVLKRMRSWGALPRRPVALAQIP